ncbi:MAG: FixH family protein [Vicinamibacteraceae bacterium]
MTTTPLRRFRKSGRWVARGALLLVAAIAAACSGTPGDPVEAQAGPYALTAHLNPDPPKQSGGTVHLQVRDAKGEPVTGADVSVGYFMPAMGAMAAMKGNLDVEERDDGVYLAALDLPMEGNWRIDVAVAGTAGRGMAAYGLRVGGKGLKVEESSGAPAASTQRSRTLPKEPYPAPVYESLSTAFTAYQEARAALAADKLEGVPPPATRAAQALAAAASGLADRKSAAAVVSEAERTARSLAKAADIEGARSTFGELSRALLLVASADERLTEGLTVWSCPMTKTFPKWIQREGEKENPYMGQKMPTCGDASDWAVAAPESAAETQAHAQAAHGAKAGDEVAYYTCSMHPSVKSEDPGTCPICSMDLVPVTEQEAATATIRIDPARRQEIGVRTERVARQSLSSQIRAVGMVVYDETRLTDVTLKIPGWIGDLEVDEPGQYVRKGQTLFTLYSPELYATQEELLTAVRSQKVAAEAGSTRRMDYLVNAARKRLHLWNLSESQIDRITETGELLEYLPIPSPASGYVVEKNVVAGAAVRPAERLFRIAGIDRIWVEAEVYESELPLVEVGQRATVTLPYAPGQAFTGKVSFIYPFLQGETRTGKIRVALPNPKLVLKPDMYANVTIERDLGDRLTVPEQAILYAGERSFVFLDLGDGQLRPKQVKTGLVTDDRIEILSGLTPGDVVVTSGNFLVAAEARLKMAMEQWQ